jgi:hypothetical protein
MAEERRRDELAAAVVHDHMLIKQLAIFEAMCLSGCLDRIPYNRQDGTTLPERSDGRPVGDLGTSHSDYA